ncbi:MAG: endonuclease III domain-containing protein [Sedimentisphaeraceae bacterium JB056]
MNSKIQQIYDLLFEAFGPQEWWPGESRFEIMLGAVLTQNTNWKNVEKAINNIKNAGLMNPVSLYKLSHEELAELIKPAGYFNVKTKRLKNLLGWLFDDFGGSLEQVDRLSDYALREQLLAVKGVGPETADSIMLYAFERPVFVVDTYTARVMIRHGMIDEYCDYEQLREFLEGCLVSDVRLFNEYHALLVRVGKDYCRPKPKCENCPLNVIPKVEFE